MVSAAPILLALASFAAGAPAAAPPAEPQALAAARSFGRALTSATASALDPLLPRRGKVQLHLVRLGPEDGSYSAGQVLALFADFLRQGSVASFELQPGEGRPPGGGYAIAHARATIVDREGRRGSSELHLTFEPEGERWVLREIREAPP